MRNFSKTLKPHETVRIKMKNNWIRKGKIIKKLRQPRLYLVLSEEENTVKQDRCHLLKTKENIHVTKIDYENILPKSTHNNRLQPPQLQNSTFQNISTKKWTTNNSPLQI